MKLYEFEGKQLLKDAGITVPEGYVIESTNEIQVPTQEIVIKAQTLEGKRGKAGLIKSAKTKEEIEAITKQFLNKKHGFETVKKVLIEKKCKIKHEFYVAVTYDTKTRNPVMIVSSQGGIDIEETKNTHPSTVIVEQINILDGLTEHEAKHILHKAQITNISMIPLLQKIYKTFMDRDMKLLEINPLIETETHELIAADAKIIFDDDALYRQNFNFPQRIGIGREKTEREIKANEINAMDHRGIAGKTYIELEGDIGILASGGGASITAVDALISYKQRPANYTEYSGNPSPEKVEALTRIVMSDPNLKGLFVVGAKANFTQIHETITAIIKVIREIKPEYPIVFRRAGPGDKEAKKLVESTARELQLDMEWYGDETPITVAAKRMSDKINRYKNKCCC
jgi:succinyl-CoA synthetase beta subunit